jgi:hypothetical protein
MTRPTPKEPREPKKPTASRRTTILQTEDTSTATPTPEPESRPRRRRVQSAVSTANATPTATPALLMMPAPLDTPAVTSIPPLARPSSASLSRTISVSVEDADDDPLVSVVLPCPVFGSLQWFRMSSGQLRGQGARARSNLRL